MTNDSVSRLETYNEKWKIVKDLMCGADYWECQDLEEVLDLKNV